MHWQSRANVWVVRHLGLSYNSIVTTCPTHDVGNMGEHWALSSYRYYPVFLYYMLYKYLYIYRFILYCIVLHSLYLITPIANQSIVCSKVSSYVSALTNFTCCVESRAEAEMIDTYAYAIFHLLMLW